MIVIHMSIKCLLCVECLWTVLAAVEKHAGEVDRLHMNHHVVLLCITFAAHVAGVQRLVSSVLALDVFQENAPVWPYDGSDQIYSYLHIKRSLAFAELS
jgi:hypothetical protein